MFLSVIIPVYNAVDTIERCLNSIWSQDIPANDYEVICVDDCSTDGSLDILRHTAEVHSELRVLRNSTNLRAGGARNHGVREARGEYIVFVDADDYFHQGALNKAYEEQKKLRLDILMYDMSRQHHENEETRLTLNFPNQDIMEGKKFIEVNTCPYGPTKYVFKKDLMIDNDIWFEENCCCEDVDWCLRLALKAKSMRYAPQVLTINILNDSSTTAIEHKSIKTVSDKLFAAERLMNIQRQADLSDKLLSYIKGVANLYIYEGIKYMTACNAPVKEKMKYISHISEYFNNTPPITSRLVKIAIKVPFLYAIISNMASCFVPHIIYIKRRIKKR